MNSKKFVEKFVENQCDLVGQVNSNFDMGILSSITRAHESKTT